MTIRLCSYRDRQGLYRCTECGKEIHQCSCFDPDENADHRLWSAQGRLFGELKRRLQIWLDEQQGSRYNVVNLQLEQAELLRKLKNHREGEGVTPDEIHQACLRVAAAALLLSLRGDEDFPYEPEVIHEREDIPR